MNLRVQLKFSPNLKLLKRIIQRPMNYFYRSRIYYPVLLRWLGLHLTVSYLVFSASLIIPTTYNNITITIQCLLNYVNQPWIYYPALRWLSLRTTISYLYSVPLKLRQPNLYLLSRASLIRPTYNSIVFIIQCHLNYVNQPCIYYAALPWLGLRLTISYLLMYTSLVMSTHFLFN